MHMLTMMPWQLLILKWPLDQSSISSHFMGRLLAHLASRLAGPAQRHSEWILCLNPPASSNVATAGLAGLATLMDPPLDPVVVNEKNIKLNGRFPLPRLIPDGNSNEASMNSQKHAGFSFDSVQLINFIIHWDCMGQNKAETQGV